MAGRDLPWHGRPVRADQHTLGSSFQQGAGLMPQTTSTNASWETSSPFTTSLHSGMPSSVDALAPVPPLLHPCMMVDQSSYVHTNAAQALRNDLVKQQHVSLQNQQVQQQALQLEAQRLRHGRHRSPEWVVPGETEALSSTIQVTAPAAAAVATAVPDEAGGPCPEEVRGVVVGWLVEAVTALGLGPATLAGAVELMDAFMVRQAVPPPNRIVQLLSLTCLNLASELEGTSGSPGGGAEITSLATDPATGAALYQADDFRRMEWLVLETLEWRTLLPSAHGFLQRLMHCLESDPRVRSACRLDGGRSGMVPAVRGLGTGAIPRVRAIANFLAELALPCADLQGYRRSTLATACLLLALQLTAVAAAPPPPPPPPASLAASSSTAAPTAAATETALSATPGTSNSPSCGSFAEVAGASLLGSSSNCTTRVEAPVLTSPDATRREHSDTAPGLRSAAASNRARDSSTNSDCCSDEDGGPRSRRWHPNPSPQPYSGTAPTTAVTALAAAFGVTEEQLAPGLEPCAEVLRALLNSALYWVRATHTETRGSSLQAGTAVSPPPAWLSVEVLERHVDIVRALLTERPIYG